MMETINNTETNLTENNLAKRVYCLYRVSTKKQVDKQKDDIPMQKIACQDFVNQQGWVIAKEFYEKGVSGFKVSANDRDAIQDLKEAALNKEFDVLLVYMFDRLGRRDDETPFVVEWFAKNGIEVWSTQEGQQRFENQTDKLLNYIRYWQATGESVKTSMRLKTRMAQLTADGIYHGGATPLGYRAVNLGRINKKGQQVKDLQIDPKEAEYVKMIFDKTLNEGYGSYRMAEHLNKMGVRTHGGSEFQCNTINRILKNRIYCGYYVAGETTSPKLKHLVIIDENVFDSVQHILKQRSKKNDEKQHIARTTKGKTLLSGNIYCAHCGTRLTSSENKERYVWANIEDIVLLKNPIDISEFNGFLKISRQSGITMIPFNEFEKLKEIILSKNNNLPVYFTKCKIGDYSLTKIDDKNFLTLTQNYRRRFLLEADFRSYYVDYILKNLFGSKVYRECICHTKHSKVMYYVDNAFINNDKVLMLEVKLNVNNERNLTDQLEQYVNSISIDLTKNNRTNTYVRSYMYVIDTAYIYKYYHSTKSLEKIVDLDNIRTFEDIENLKSILI